MLAGAHGPLYTLGPGDSSYRQVAPEAPLQGGAGYWAYFDTLTPETLPAAGPESMTIQLPPARYVMIGNPRSTIAVVYGADAVYIYVAEKQTIGTKRNLACEAARGEVVCHFDDDDADERDDDADGDR